MAVAYARVLIKDFWQEGAPTHAERADQGEASSATKPAAVSWAKCRVAPGSTSPLDGVITTRHVAWVSTVSAWAGVSMANGTWTDAAPAIAPSGVPAIACGNVMWRTPAMLVAQLATSRTCHAPDPWLARRNWCARSSNRSTASVAETGSPRSEPPTRSHP